MEQFCSQYRACSPFVKLLARIVQSEAAQVEYYFSFNKNNTKKTYTVLTHLFKVFFSHSPSRCYQSYSCLCKSSSSFMKWISHQSRPTYADLNGHTHFSQHTTYVHTNIHLDINDILKHLVQQH